MTCTYKSENRDCPFPIPCTLCEYWTLSARYKREQRRKKTRYGVWCCPARIGKRGDDYYYEFENVEEAKNFIANHKEADRTYFRIAEEVV